MKNLVILAPNDRYNYGDLLFTHIINHYLVKGRYGKIINASITNADLTEVGGHQVFSLSQLEEKENADLILAGGETLLTDWIDCLRFIDSNFSVPKWFNEILSFVQRHYSLWIQLELKNIYGKYKAKGKSKYPYAVVKGEYKNIDRIFYNSIGGAWLNASSLSSKRIERLKSVDYISVRDSNALSVLTSLGVNAVLVPDSALLMSDVFSIDSLKEKSSDEVLEFIGSKTYCVFQVNKIEGEKHFNEICSELCLIHDKFGFDIALCAIGYAPGHDDVEILKHIHDVIDRPYIKLFVNQNIWEIMLLISNSKYYLGTSLHGVITSMSYKIPYLGLFRYKTGLYIKTWSRFSEFQYTEKCDFAAFIQKLQQMNTEELFDDVENQKKIILKSFNTIFNYE